ERDLVAGVEEDAEERVREPAGDDLVELAPGRADAERAVPLCDRGEVRPDESVDVVADRLGQLGGVVDDPAGPAVERAPGPEGGREGIAALDRSVVRAIEAEPRPRPGRQHEMAGERRAVPTEERHGVA